MKSNLATVTVNGVAVSRNARLQELGSFMVTTDEGNTYRVLRTDDGKSRARWSPFGKSLHWNVIQIEAGGKKLVGQIRRPFNPLGYSGQYVYYKGPLNSHRSTRWSSGSQTDLWNAVQGLTD